MVNRVSCWASLTGRSRNRIWLRNVNIAVLAPMPNASDNTATVEKTGDLRAERKA